MLAGVSIGAVGAAVIAAMITFVGLLISKENKTSDFRQDWIDSLRSEISSFITSSNAIADELQRQYRDDNEKIDILSPLYRELNKSSYHISLRLNQNENEAKCLLDKLSNLQKHCTSDPSEISVEEIRRLEGEVLVSARALLKGEWKRVKRGEPIFRIAKWGFGLFLVLVLVIGLRVGYLAYSTDGGRMSGREADAAIGGDESKAASRAKRPPSASLNSSGANPVRQSGVKDQ